MLLEDEASLFLQQLEYSCCASEDELPDTLKAVSMMLGLTAKAAERWRSQPGLLVSAARHGFGLWMADGLLVLAKSGMPEREQQFPLHQLEALQAELVQVCNAFGRDISHWAEVMDCFFRDLLEAAHGHPEPNDHLCKLLHLALGIEAAYSWHRICKAAERAA
ncbi:hypothetical protein EYS42_03250 [Aquabacterium lacunae]|uniref:Uncharacterized protein n=1 Tax=Aquabacterium lacunae TaxID=2528630 RepID=A0A4Q9H2V7_9BURK|nr:hypothetical protein [Aquabacterium lacunae]TBO34442.1 hypothetical protein EYS42_03250 [Aquabacterium lacunae]